MTADEAAPERLHPLSLISGLGQTARNLFGGIAAGGYFTFQGQAELGASILIAICAVAILGQLLGWLTFSFRVGDDAVQIDSGLVSRNHRTIPFDRVADVSIEQGPLQRLAGVAKVTLETGGSSAGKEEGVLGAISLRRAETLRDHIRSRRSMEPAAEHAMHAEDTPPLFAMTFRRVLALGFFNFSLALFAGLIGATQTLGNAFDIDPFERKFWRPILTDGGWSEWLLGHRLGVAVGGAAVLIAVGIVTGVVRTVSREFGFRLDRTGAGLRRRRGLLTRTDVTLPLRRIQAGVIVTGPVRDWFGWRAFKVQSLASDATGGARGGDHVLAPLANDDEVLAIAQEIGWSSPNEALMWRPVSTAYVTSFCLLLAPVFPLLIVLAPLRWLEWHRTAWAQKGDRLWLRTGWWRRRTLLLPLRNVQTVDLQETSLSRWLGAATLAIGTAGGSAGGYRIPYLPQKEASLLHRDLLRLQP